MRYCDGIKLICSEMVEDEDGRFRSIEGTISSVQEHMQTTADHLPTLQECAKSWAAWMQSQGHDVYELPRTLRTRDWGLTYSVTAKGKESQLYLLTFEF